MDPDVLFRASAVVALLGLTSFAWWFATRRRGELRPVRTRRSTSAGRREPAPPTLDRVRTAVAVTAGARATVVQISAEYCSPCRRSAALWTDLVATDPALAFVEVDGGQHLDLTREFGVLSTPTSLLFDTDGTLVGRIGGAPTRVQATQALAHSANTIGLTRPNNSTDPNNSAGSAGTDNSTTTDRIGAER
ncbi:thioredoxin family protein [Occultella glacieicola]|uniref:thioredoxin family protein n=1 Tax=Occultella glacieicola TaxID=2518684 RepID=UPI00140436D2|nr:thioredoxin family protein [Occultella glacieicola]